METLDLHGIRHKEVDRLVENFVLLNELPVKIITGNSITMRSLVTTVLDRYEFSYNYESYWNLGSLVVRD